MDFTLKTNKFNKEITISKDIAQKIISVLDKVDCTAVWSESDMQYIKVNDIPTDIVDYLVLKLNLAK